MVNKLRSKVVTMEEALSKFKDGQTIMFGDWHGEFSAEEIITGMLEKGVKDIHAIAVSGGMPDQGVGRLIHAHRVKSLATTHIAYNPSARDQMFAGELDIEFVPQGTFAERIRCGGYGLGGCLTPTGLGTDVAVGKQVLNINGKDYLLELPMHADIALIKAWKADTAGNIAFRLMSRATTVSYTHLDVYKRQIISPSFCERKLYNSRPMISSAEIFVPSVIITVFFRKSIFLTLPRIVR